MGNAHAYLNRVSTAVPAHEIHNAFVQYARGALETPKQRSLFERLVDRAQIARRFSVLAPGARQEGVDGGGFYMPSNFPGTGERMQTYARCAPVLAAEAVAGLNVPDPSSISHLLVTSCTGFMAPGLDVEIAERCRLRPSVERSVIGFMGCAAAVNALKLANHIVRADASARVLVVNLELCSLHLQETDDIEQMLTFLLFADGCASSLVSSEPAGLRLGAFRSELFPGTHDLLTWRVGDQGFDMGLSSHLPQAIRDQLRVLAGDLPQASLWALHPGGRAVLDAVQDALKLESDTLRHARDVLREYGNMSSATLMFVLQRVMAEAKAGERGCALAFGPGVSAESFAFQKE